MQVKKAVIDQVKRICRKVANCNSCKKDETASSLRQYCYISEGFYGLNFTSKTDFQPTAQKLLPKNLFPLFLPFALTFFNKQTKLGIIYHKNEFKGFYGKICYFPGNSELRVKIELQRKFIGK